MSAQPTADYVPHNILLTGGCGFIGSHVCKFLVSFRPPVIINWLVASVSDMVCVSGVSCPSQVQKYPQYNFVNLDILDSCASLNNVKSIERFKNYTFVKGSIGNMDLVIFGLNLILV